MHGILIYHFMDFLEEVSDKLKGTSIEEGIREISFLYSTLCHDIDQFLECHTVKCPDGCGKCCEIFNPDITKLESLYLAAFILFSGKKEKLVKRLEEKGTESGGTCPLYDDRSVFHCMCYQARPLICRLFASSAFPGKHNERKFSNCHLNRDFISPGSIEEDAPLMGSYGAWLADLNGGENTTEPLSERVLKDIELIEYYMGMQRQ